MAQKRSPILGYNHNFRHHGRVFHVQTEDSGVDNPHVFTHLFHGGVIISSRKLDYDPASSEEAVKSLMQAQHKAMLRLLKEGTFDAKIVQYLGPHPDGTPAPDTPAPADLPPPVSTAELPPPTAAPQFIDEEEISVKVRFNPPQPIERAEPSEPVHIHQPAPADAPPSPDVARYIQRGGREAPLVNTGQLPAVSEADAPPPARAPEHVDEGPTTPVAQGKRGRRSSQPPPIPAPARRRPTRPPSRPPNKQFVRSRPSTMRPPAKPPASSGVVVSRPAVIVGGDDQQAPRSRRPSRPPAAPAPPASRPATNSGKGKVRSARETASNNANSLFGRDLISEKSLDEVILAYLSEDTEE